MQKVSVVIPNYNYGRFIGEAIESVLAQTYPNIEIVVVDDGSTDDSLSILENYAERVRVIRQQNKGVGVARNQGAKESSGAFIAFLDADDIWKTDKIEKQIAQFTADSEVGLVSCGMREFNPQGQTIGEFFGILNGYCTAEFVAFKDPVVVSGSAIVVRRDIFERIGGFDERKDLHPSEDWEFCYRVSLISKMVFMPDLLVDYRNHGANGHLKTAKMERAMLLAYEKIFSSSTPEISKLKRQSYGNLHRSLSGDYFYSSNYPAFLRQMAKSIWYSPENIKYYLQFPWRLWRRRAN